MIILIVLALRNPRQVEKNLFSPIPQRSTLHICKEFFSSHSLMHSRSFDCTGSEAHAWLSRFICPYRGGDLLHTLLTASPTPTSSLAQQRLTLLIPQGMQPHPIPCQTPKPFSPDRHNQDKGDTGKPHPEESMPGGQRCYWKERTKACIRIWRILAHNWQV